MDTKICNKCKQEKLVSEFYKSKTDKGGYRWSCKSCCREATKIYAKTGYFVRYNRQYYQRAEVKEHINSPEFKERVSVKLREYNQNPDVRIKNMARWYSNNRIRAGELQREPCALCGQEQGEAHHLDYNEPLLIVWLCGECHRKVHIEDKG
ncbi:hypothetical protein LCGC14_1154820 [marine sediment metagenome]|uniref:HNH domain-containing protein n=1 Tax=marine sediment metagenome TaxID=412755 RepID=A0A0F9MHH2_9ZZZZ